MAVGGFGIAPVPSIIVALGGFSHSARAATDDLPICGRRRHRPSHIDLWAIGEARRECRSISRDSEWDFWDFGGTRLVAF